MLQVTHIIANEVSQRSGFVLRHGFPGDLVQVVVMDFAMGDLLWYAFYYVGKVQVVRFPE